MERLLHPTPQEEVLILFAKACRQGDLELADHLLRILEALACRPHGEQLLERAYRLLA
ncbi:hypothetical protein [Cupriavidus necator]|uniref:hypothetical protein n=1 Tax=Cupriavidus necator TaxID=106590 RepID=UPI00339D3A16